MCLAQAPRRIDMARNDVNKIMPRDAAPIPRQPGAPWSTGTSRRRKSLSICRRGSASLSSVAMGNAARLFTCASCRRQVVLCRRCDHGNIYCSRNCSGRARRRSMRLAGRRYQDSRRGRHKHAERQRCYRERRRRPVAETPACAKKVTHHPLTAARRRPFVTRTPAGRSGIRPIGPHRPAKVFRCDRCGRFCAHTVYPGPRPARRE